MVVYVAGAAIVRGGDPAEASLEELVFEAAAAALTDAGTTRAESLAASDQLDGRVISSMHLAGQRLVDDRQAMAGYVTRLGNVTERPVGECSPNARSSWTSSAAART
jgi:acetyl-CoA acetyltransferase